MRHILQACIGVVRVLSKYSELLSLKVIMLRPGDIGVKHMHALCIADVQGHS